MQEDNSHPKTSDTSRVQSLIGDLSSSDTTAATVVDALCDFAPEELHVYLDSIMNAAVSIEDLQSAVQLYEHLSKADHKHKLYSNASGMLLSHDYARQIAGGRILLAMSPTAAFRNFLVDMLLTQVAKADDDAQALALADLYVASAQDSTRAVRGLLHSREVPNARRAAVLFMPGLEDISELIFAENRRDIFIAIAHGVHDSKITFDLPTPDTSAFVFRSDTPRPPWSGSPRTWPQIGMQWLADKRQRVPHEGHESLTAQDLKLLDDVVRQQLAVKHADEVSMAIEELQAEIHDRRQAMRTQPFIDALRGDDEEIALRNIERLAELDTAAAPRTLVQEWIRWIVIRQRGVRAEFAAEKLRRKPDAVLPLLDALEQSVDWDQYPDEIVYALAPLESDRPIMRQIVMGSPSDVATPDLEALAERLSDTQLQSPPQAQSRISTDQGGAIRAIRDAIHAFRHERQLLVDRRIARHIAEMTEQRFFPEGADGRDDDGSGDKHSDFDSVHEKLRDFAVPVLGRRLIGEEDLETRESAARALGNLGTREAVDALTRAIVGEERTQSRRQELLESYYLDPAKHRSDEADKILADAVQQARTTLRILQVTNIVLFIAGLSLLVTGILMIYFGDRGRADLLVSLLLSGGGLGTLLLQQIRHPLARIQHAMNKLVQLETAFTSFMWQLNLNQTYIQSQYVARGVLDHSEISSTIELIARSVQMSMELVSRYGDDVPQRLVPQLVRLNPYSGSLGDRIQVYGEWLATKGGNCRVAINHSPLNNVTVKQRGDHLEFVLDGTSIVREGRPVWLSVFVDGEETNALPFYLEGDANDAGL